MAHVLVWSTANVRSIYSAAFIDVVELPRLNLAFNSKHVECVDGRVERRLYSNDHDGLFIARSTEARMIADRLLGSVSRDIVLQNGDSDLYVMIPGCAQLRILDAGGSRLERTDAIKNGFTISGKSGA